MPRSGPVLTTTRAAEYVGLKPQTLRKLKHLGEGPVAYKHGRLTVYYPADLDTWLAGRLKPAVEEPENVTPLRRGA